MPICDIHLLSIQGGGTPGAYRSIVHMLIAVW